VPQLVYNLNATIMFGTDTFLMGYANYAHPYDFYSVRYVFSGAEKLRPETMTFWANKFGVRIFDGYGATETSPVIAMNTPMQNKTGTVGRMLPGMKYEIKPVAGIETGGELCVSGPNVMKGYLLNSQPGVIQPPAEGWYNTGDIISMDREGFITIQGRVKRFAKVAGEMVSLTMVEQYISKLWPQEQHAVVSIPDKRKGEQLVLVTTRDNASRDEIVKYARSEHVNEISIPRKIMKVNKMPLLGSGKVDYTAVNHLVAEDKDN
jgi:acyl-[acyl-carrier-protein]-phospholipid O-acyltransferase/long-chain-fatty-acid--[acyl-carrier-protein] ligase